MERPDLTEGKGVDTRRAAWRGVWQDGRTGWDQGGPSRGLGALVALAREEGALAPGAAVLEPGCGRAHNGAELARLGYRVTSFDLTPEAIAEARRLYHEIPTLTLAEQDALTPVPEWAGQFDAILDRAMLCALPAFLRRAYVSACFTHLKPGGHFLTIPFTALKIAEAEGPPFQITMTQLSELLLPGFSLINAEELPPVASDTRIATETLCIWRRRSRLLIESE